MRSKRPIGVTLIALFFAFGAVMSGLAAVMLWDPGTVLDRLWSLNPRGHAGFVAMDIAGVVLMVTVCAACATAAIGLWRSAVWGYWMALLMLCVNLIGDLMNGFLMHDWRTLIGVPVAAVMIGYLMGNKDVFG